MMPLAPPGRSPSRCTLQRGPARQRGAWAPAPARPRAPRSWAGRFLPPASCPLMAAVLDLFWFEETNVTWEGGGEAL